MLCEDEKSQQENHWKCIRSKQRQENKKWKAFKKSGGRGGGPQPSGFDPSHQGSPDPPQLTVLAICNVKENLIMYLRL